jgi:hypothetical protein
MQPPPIEVVSEIITVFPDWMLKVFSTDFCVAIGNIGNGVDFDKAQAIY